VGWGPDEDCVCKCECDYEKGKGYSGYRSHLPSVQKLDVLFCSYVLEVGVHIGERFSREAEGDTAGFAGTEVDLKDGGRGA
jgi:hypothetical protein